jgi:hypothetical protein
MNIATLNQSLSTAINAGTSVVMRVSKDGTKIKTGSIARAIRFGSVSARDDISKNLMLGWLSNGTYRPVVNDIIDTLVPKAAQPFVVNLVPPSGAISKEAFLNLCCAVVNAIASSGKEPKGEKAWMYGIVRAIAQAEGNADTVLEAM